MMRILPIASVFIFIVCIQNKLNAQDKYGPGFYVTSASDTVRGFIEYQYHYNDQFKFKPTLKETRRTLTVDEVDLFALDAGDTYKKLDFALGDLSVKPVFAQALLLGDISLFRYQGRLFIDGGGSNRFQLANGKARNTEDATKQLQKNTGYFNILFQECPTVTQESSKITISPSSVITLVSKYHECKKTSYVNLSEKRKRRIDFGFSLGLATPSIKYPASVNLLGEGPSTDFLSRTLFAQSPASPSIGITYINRGRNPSSLVALQHELLFSRVSFNGSSFANWEAAGYEFTETSTTLIKFSKIDYKIGMRITPRSNVINPYFSVGATLVSVLANKSKSHVTFQINDSVEERDLNPVDGKSIGTWGALGISKAMGTKHKVFAEVLFERTPVSSNGKVSTFHYRVGFLF